MSSGWGRYSLSAFSTFLLSITIACGGGLGTQPTGSSKTLTSLSVTPTSVAMNIGLQQQLTATATYSDGTTANVTSSAAWTVSDMSVANVSASGMVSAISSGTATASASLSGKTAASAVTVNSSQLVTLSFITTTPANVSLVVGGTQQMAATATYSDGSRKDVTSSATWTSSNSTIATVSASGLVAGALAGNATINAHFMGQSTGSAVSVTAAPPTLVSIAVAPMSFSVAAGATRQITATGTYSDGTNKDITSSVAWSSSNVSVASVGSTGLVTGIGAGTASITAALSGLVANAAVTVPGTVPPPPLVSITVTPATATVIVGSTQQMTATANYSDGEQIDVTGSATWTSSAPTIATINSVGLVTAAASGNSTITATYQTKAATAAIAVGANIVTWHNDNLRSGLNSGEGILTPQNVNTQTFGKLFSYQVDAYIYAQPLVVSNLTINGAPHNVVYVATENDSVYAFDADQYGSGEPLWEVSLLQPAEFPISGGAILPISGVTATPAIDLSSNTLYIISTEQLGGVGSFRLHALDLTTGAEKLGGPVLIQASVPGTNQDSIDGVVYLTTSCMHRAALLLDHGSLYIGFGSCHSGWLLAYNAQTLAQTGVFNMSPNLNGEGTYGGAGGVWMGGGGPAADSDGNVYVTTGNGPYDGLTAWGESVMKFDPQLNLLDHFTPWDWDFMDCRDSDLASGGLLLIPGTTEAVAGGKKGMMYLVNTTNLGGMQPNDAGATQTLWFEPDLSPPYPASCTDANGNTFSTDINSYEIFGTSAFFNGSVYLGITPTSSVAPGPIRQFPYSGLLALGSYTNTSVQQGSMGSTPFISAAGTSSGIVWMIDHGQPIQDPLINVATPAVLRAFDASDLSVELYDSSQNPADTAGLGMKFSSPIVVNGKVFIGTAHDQLTTQNPQGELDVYGLK
jgi:uncharacterized protein YjdB